MSLEEIRGTRLKKKEHIEQSGMEAYPASVSRTHAIDGIRVSFSRLEKAHTRCVIAGRVRSLRAHGGSTFADIEDGSSRMQIYIKKDAVGEDAYALFLEGVDIGDIIEVAGTVFLTKKQEQTLKVASWRMLAKALRPLPEKWHGLIDVEERFRRRYLDLAMNEDVRARFILRSRMVSAIRSFFDSEEFLEVETPMLHSIAGGAIARPFVTHHNALDTDFYLRIAPELYLKRLLVGGYERVYELGKSFRNEGIDHTHNPEFTTIEWYAAYWDENDMMACVERCLRFVLTSLGLKKSIAFQGNTISFQNAFSRIPFTEVLKRHALIVDYEKETRDSLAVRARQFGIDIGPHEIKGKIADEIFRKICRPRLIEPTFVTNLPADISPLAKASADHPGEVRRFLLEVGGWEIVNAFSELNDPLDQRARFEEQERGRTAGDTELHKMDEDFIEALEYGMPPAAGAAIGIDRLAMLLTDTTNIREVLLFPTLRPKSD